MAATCHFCDARVVGETCGSCGRDQAARRRVCAKCKKMTPVAEPQCSHCGQTFRNELRWKIPVIMIMFVVAIGVSVAVRLNL